ncbi:hypothetical protein PFISCL1PPCAC_3814, partial [Pristionchus fissidentatus]
RSSKMSGDVGGVSSLPYSAQYSKGSFRCATCLKMMDVGCLQLGLRELQPSIGQTDSWYHLDCFFVAMKRKKLGVDAASIRGMSWLKWDDQESIRSEIEKLDHQGGTSDNNYQALSSIRAEHAKSAKGKCGSCKGYINKDEAKFFCRGAFHHLACLVKMDLRFMGPVDSIQGFAALQQAAQDEAKAQIEARQQGKTMVKKEEKQMDGVVTHTAAAAAASATGRDEEVEEEDSKDDHGSSDSAVAALATGSVSCTSLAAAAAAADDDDDDIQLVDVVVTDKPLVVTIDAPLAPIFKPVDKTKSSLNDLLSRYKKTESDAVTSSSSLADVLHSLPKRPKMDEELEKEELNRLLKKTESDAVTSSSSLADVLHSLPKRPKMDEELEKEELNRLLKKQSDGLWALRSEFEQIKEKDIRELMKSNDMHIPTSFEQLIMSVCDAALFGVPVQCSKCADGRLVFSMEANTYQCMGNLSEWTKCTYTNKNPTRSPLGIPRSLAATLVAVQELNVMSSLSRRHYLVTSGEPLKKRLPQVAMSAELAEGETVKNAHMRIMNLPGLPGFPGLRVPAPTAGKLIIKRGTVVDGECEVASDTHVYRDDGGVLFMCSLTQADLATNRNSYYKMQLLQHDRDSNVFYLFKSWGRVGTELGSSETTPFYHLEDAKQEYLRMFKEKTGNDWADKKYFRKRPGMMAMVDLDYSEVENKKDSDVEAGSLTKLDKAVQNLIMRIFDKEMFKSALKSFDLDMDQMPLGKLSRKQLDLAYGVLNELQAMVTAGGGTRDRLTDATNRFYSLIPHNFGHKAFEMLDSKESILKKTKLIENLIDIAIAVDLMKDAPNGATPAAVATLDPIDVNYLKLKSEITVLPRDSPDYAMIEKYTRNTHGSTHFTKIDITDIYCVSREGEEARFNADLGNRMLLWHGSRLSNYVGIISQGLRIAPPEAPHAGYMFGKGIYFADMISKSANYCHPDLSSNDAFLLLCDVALGQIQEEPNATSVNPLRNGNTAVKGIGYQFPDPSDSLYHDDGFVVPYGRSTRGLEKIYLEYNEFIVYDVSQVRIRYLVRTKMNWK